MNDNFGIVHSAIEKQNSKMDDLRILSRYLKDTSQSLSVFTEGMKANNHECDSQRILTFADKVIALFKETVLSNSSLYNMETDTHQMLLDKLMCENMIESVWSNHANGKFIYSKPAAGIANARIREWFKESISGKSYVSEVYISAITHQPCVTVSVPIIREDQCIGVLGADLKLS